MSKLTKALTAAAGNAGESLYVEDVFSTYLYEGNDANGTTEQQISNGIDLSGEGGMVWMKSRDGGRSHCLYDTERGNGDFLASNTTAASSTNTNTPWRPTSTGFYTGRDYGGSENQNGESIVSWTFRKAKKFFDVVTYSSDTTSGARTLSHNLGSTPAFIIVKGLNFADAWYVYHIGTGVNYYFELNLTGAGHASNNFWGVTDSTFTVDSFLNNNGSTGRDYVAYLFASDAGGFGDNGSENIIKCGTYTGNASTNGPEINLGFEPQWVYAKRTDSGGTHGILDVMRGMPVGGTSGDLILFPNTSDAELDQINLAPTATGFKLEDDGTFLNQSGATYVYVAIRRPMKTPEAGTEVFAMDTLGGTAPNPPGFNGLLVDWAWKRVRNTSDDFYSQSRLLGTSELKLNVADAEGSALDVKFDYQDGWNNSNGTLSTQLSLMFKRATGFFDVVAYTGSTSVYQKPHNLKVTPELMIVKNRGANEVSWSVYTATTGANNRLQLNSTGASSATSDWDNASDVGVAPTATHFNVKGASVTVNNASYAYIAYLFATLDGVSKVGSYTGTGSNVNVDCGFSAGARFILIKRTDSTGDWYVWNSLRGIVAGNDPYLLLNTTAAEVTNTDYVDPLSSGFTVTSSAPAALNASGGTYIFLAIA